MYTSTQVLLFALGVGLGLVRSGAMAQDVVLDSEHNSTSLEGTWASGTKNVITGPGFANPSNESFTYPKTAGISYSFTNDGYYEIARYRFVSNATNPSCIAGNVIWVHGTYECISNGSIILTPFGDGYQQVQDACAGTSNFVQFFNDTELITSWRIFTDITYGYKLHLWTYDGTPLAPQFQISPSPEMLPTQKLRDTSANIVTTTTDGFVTQSTVISKRKRTLWKRSKAERASQIQARWLGAVVGGAIVAGVVAVCI